MIKWFFITLDFVKHYIKTEMMFWWIYATTIKFKVQDRTDHIDIVQILWKYLGVLKY